jgi:TPR repeat protein
MFNQNLSQENNSEKVIYKDMLEYLKNSNDANQLMILGSLYVNGSTEPDSIGETIKADPILAEKYLLKSYELGNIRSLTILGGFILLNERMRKIDPDLKKAEELLSKSFYGGDLEAGTLLANLISKKKFIKKG